MIFSGESLLQKQASPWTLILTEPVPELFEFRTADRPEKYFVSVTRNRSEMVEPDNTNLVLNESARVALVCGKIRAVFT